MRECVRVYTCNSSARDLYIYICVTARDFLLFFYVRERKSVCEWSSKACHNLLIFLILPEGDTSERNLELKAPGLVALSCIHNKAKKNEEKEICGK